MKILLKILSFGLLETEVKTKEKPLETGLNVEDEEMLNIPSLKEVK